LSNFLIPCPKEFVLHIITNREMEVMMQAS
jgi:hypothetical protein